MNVLTSWRRVLWFALRFAAVFCGLTTLWPVIETPYAELYRSAGSQLLPETSAASLTLSVPLPAAEHAPGYNLLLSALPLHARGALSMPIDLRGFAYLPTAALLALALATPLWHSARAAVRLLGALLVLHVFIAWSIVAPLVLFFANPEPLALVSLSPISALLLNVSYRSLVTPPGMAYAIPGAIWLGALWLWPERPTHAGPCGLVGRQSL